MNAKQYLVGDATCISIKDGQLYQATTSGIRPLLNWLQETPCPLYQGDVSDRVVGKAAALLFCYANIQSLYAEVISEHALEVFQDKGIKVEYGKVVPYIINRTKTGMCPMEAKVLNIQNPQVAYEILK